jgi:uncharacterized membrane protein YidH (DUF202 family)
LCLGVFGENFLSVARTDWLATRLGLIAVGVVLVAFALAHVSGIAYPPIDGIQNPVASRIGKACFGVIALTAALFSIDILVLLYATWQNPMVHLL